MSSVSKCDPAIKFTEGKTNSPDREQVKTHSPLRPVIPRLEIGALLPKDSPAAAAVVANVTVIPTAFPAKIAAPKPKIFLKNAVELAQNEYERLIDQQILSNDLEGGLKTIENFFKYFKPSGDIEKKLYNLIVLSIEKGNALIFIKIKAIFTKYFPENPEVLSLKIDSKQLIILLAEQGNAELGKIIPFPNIQGKAPSVLKKVVAEQEAHATKIRSICKEIFIIDPKNAMGIYLMTEALITLINIHLLNESFNEALNFCTEYLLLNNIDFPVGAVIDVKLFYENIHKSDEALALKGAEIWEKIIQCNKKKDLNIYGHIPTH